jgi:hypothetical protein
VIGRLVGDHEAPVLLEVATWHRPEPLSLATIAGEPLARSAAPT